VIDTNVWLDLFVFMDPRARCLGQALAAPSDRGLVAVRSAQTDAEIDSVLQRPRFAPLAAAHSGSLARWQSMAKPVQVSGHAPWICSDRDDQKFLDLAFAVRATLLLTKDKALLSLNRRTPRDGLRILSPDEFGRRFPHDGSPQRECIVERMVAT
jgi:putative PIN family toxin of toxin-antitoxin system